jgi:hypothetical protein
MTPKASPDIEETADELMFPRELANMALSFRLLGSWCATGTVRLRSSQGIEFPSGIQT